MLRLRLCQFPKVLAVVLLVSYIFFLFLFSHSTPLPFTRYITEYNSVYKSANGFMLCWFSLSLSLSLVYSRLTSSSLFFTYSSSYIRKLRVLHCIATFTRRVLLPFEHYPKPKCKNRILIQSLVSFLFFTPCYTLVMCLILIILIVHFICFFCLHFAHL